MRKFLYNRCLDIKTHYLNPRPTSSEKFSRPWVVTGEKKTAQAARRVRPSSRREKPLGPRNSFWLNLCIAARACAPHLDLRGPFCAVINAPGPLHFHPTARRCTARRQDECIAPSSPTCRSSVPGPIRSRVCKLNRVHTGERDGKNERGEILSLYICRRRTIVGKIITVFTAEREYIAGRQSRLLLARSIGKFRVRSLREHFWRDQKFVNSLWSYMLKWTRFTMIDRNPILIFLNRWSGQ